MTSGAPMMFGIVQGIKTVGLLTIPSGPINSQATMIVMIGFRMNGIARIGFATIGNPNVTGSLTWKTPGATANLETSTYPLFLENSRTIMISDNVEPVPPMLANIQKNACVKM